MSTQGRNANINGQRFEDVVSSVLEQTKQMKVVKYQEIKTQLSSLDNVIIKNYPYTNYFGNTKARGDLYIKSGDKKIRIECRCQNGPGTVTEKFPALFMNMSNMVENDVIAVVNGNGIDSRALNWFKFQAQQSNKDFKVFNFEEFKSWAIASFGDNNEN